MKYVKIMQSYSEYSMGTICRYLKCIKFSIENSLQSIKRLVFQFIVVHSDVENEQLRGSQTQSEFPLIKYNKMGDTFMRVESIGKLVKTWKTCHCGTSVMHTK